MFKAPDEGNYRSCRCDAPQEEQAFDIVDEVRQADLRLRSRDPDGPDTRERIFDLALLACRIASGIGRPFGLLRWTWLTKPFLSMNSSLAADL
jgi:hypothetical protein